MAGAVRLGNRYLAHLLSALVLTLTIVGIPFAKQHFKLIPLSLFPFGRNLL